MKRLQGIAASNGIAIAKAYRLEHPDLTVEKQTIENPAEHVRRFQLLNLDALNGTPSQWQCHSMQQ